MIYRQLLKRIGRQWFNADFHGQGKPEEGDQPVRQPKLSKPAKSFILRQHYA